MTGGKPWTDEENQLLITMIAERLSIQEIIDSGKFPERTPEAVKVQHKRLGGPSSETTKQITTVEEIEPSKDNLSMDEVVKLFSSGFRQICGIKEVDKHTLERFRIIFQAARDYGPLLAHHEKWDKIEKKIEELSAAVVELRSAKGTAKA